MSFQKYQSDSYCAGGRHRSATTKFYGDLSSKISKVIIGYCLCIRKKFKIIFDKTIQAEGPGSFFNSLGRFSAKAGKKLANIVVKNPGRPLEIISIIATAAATKGPKAALSSLPGKISFNHTGSGLYLPRLA